jgi:NAD(P)-dependent dehydrogenase (short-subunit alcohol dehydrogenase family)
MAGIVDGDKILVVGGAGGIGAGIAELFGDRAVVFSRRSGVDATNVEQLATALDRFAAEHGAPFALVHTVGEFEERGLLDTDMSLYRRLLDSNLTSAFCVCRAVVPHMVRAGRGRVLLFAAAGADRQRAMTRAPVYFAAKAALLSMARSLAAEVANSGIAVNVLSPGIIRHTDSHRSSQDRMEPKVPLGRSGTVEDVLGLVRLLLSDEGSYITGANFTVDGGLSV